MYTATQAVEIDMDQAEVRSLVYPASKVIVLSVGVLEDAITRMVERVWAMEPDEETRVLILAPTQLMADDLSKVFPNSTSNQTWLVDPDSIWNNIQVAPYRCIEDLERVPEFDEVYILSATAVLDAVVCGDVNGGMVWRNFNRFQLLLTRAKLVVCACTEAGLDNSLLHFLNSTLDPKEISWQRYTRSGVHRELRVTHNKTAWEDQLIQTLQERQRVVLCCRNNQRAKAFAIRLNSVAASQHADQVRIVTSKGAFESDSREPWDRIFIDATGVGCSMRNLFRMCEHWKRIGDPNVQFLVDSGFGDHDGALRADDLHAYETTLQELFDEGQEEHLEHYYQPFIRITPDWEQGTIINFKADAFTSLFASKRSEHKLSDRFAFERLAAIKQWSWTYDERA